MNNPIIDRVGNKFWLNEKGEFHREDGPAAEYACGTKCWYINGKKHREDGPATDNIDGSAFWYYDNKFIRCNSQEEFEKIIKLRMFW